MSLAGIMLDAVAGHGTHVAGIVGAKNGGAGGVVGVAPGVGIFSIKILDAQGVGETQIRLRFIILIGLSVGFAFTLVCHCATCGMRHLQHAVGQALCHGCGDLGCCPWHALTRAVFTLVFMPDPCYATCCAAAGQALCLTRWTLWPGLPGLRARLQAPRHQPQPGGIRGPSSSRCAGPNGNSKASAGQVNWLCQQT
jgi:hypothetical protein